MSTTFRKMDKQLTTWSNRIERLATQPVETAGTPTPQRIGELREMHAAALTAFTGFRAADAEARAGLKPQTVLVWNRLAAAVKTPRPTT
jgi:hypothetical protein